MKTIRSFLALKLDLSVVENIAEAQKRLRTSCSNAGMSVRWVPPPNIHMTIRFLGNITEPMAYAVKDMLEPIVSEVESFDLESLGLGAFPDTSHPRIVWAGLGQGVEVLTELHSAIYNRLLKAGFNLDDKPFKAHLTIGRVKHSPPGAFAGCLGEDVSRVFGVSHIRYLHCYSSELLPKGAEYSSVWVLPFAQDNRRAPQRNGGLQTAPSIQTPTNNDKGEESR